MMLSRLKSSLLVPLLAVVFLAGCEWSLNSSTALTVSFGAQNSDTSNDSRFLTRAAVSEVYPTLDVILLSVSTPTYSVKDINELFNNNAFTLNDDEDAFVLTNTLVALTVPNGEPLTVQIRAINLDGFQVFTGTVELDPEELSEPEVAVNVPLEVDVDENIPVLASLSECEDSDSDDLCDVYEDLFLNADGEADVDGDGQLNKNDTDADGDQVPDNLDRNASLTEGNLPTPSNDGYPMFIVANRLPVLPNVSITTAENQPFTLALPVSEVDPDRNDVVTYIVTTDPTKGSVVVNGTDIVYTPDAFFTGSDTFSIEAFDLASSFTSESVTFRVDISVVNNPSVSNTAPVANDDAQVAITSGAIVSLDVLANDSDADISNGIADVLTIVDATTTAGKAVIGIDGDELHFFSGRNESGLATITYTIEDAAGAQSSAEVSVDLRPDEDGDGLISVNTGVAVNGVTVSDSDDTNTDVNGDGLSDYANVFQAGLAATTISSNISTDTLWTIENSPLLIDSDISVTSGATLRIEQGVVVRFANNASLTITDASRLEVLGGNTKDLAVVFTSDSDPVFQASSAGTLATAGAWDGIIINSTKPSFMIGAAVYFATNGVTLSDGSHVIRNSLFSNSASAGILMNADDDSTFISNNITHNRVGVWVRNAGSGTLFNHNFIAYNAGGDSSDNGAGASVAAGISGDVTFANTYFFQNDLQGVNGDANGAGLWIGNNSRVNVLGSTFHWNQFANINGIALDSRASDSNGLVTVRDTLFDDNDGEVNADVQLTFDAQNDGVSITDTLNGESQYNWTDAGSIGTGLPDDGTNVIEDGSDALEANGIGYLGSATTATNGGSAASVFDFDYLNILSKPTTSTDGAVDDSQSDIGFHHERAAFIFSANDSAWSDSAFSVDFPNGSKTVVTTVRDASQAFGDTFNNISFSFFVGGVNTYQRYLPGGQFAVTFANNSSCSTGQSFSVFVNGTSSSVGSVDFGGAC